MKRSRGWIFLVAALLVVHAAVAGHYSGYHDGDDDFDVEIPGMLDFDQERAKDMPDTQGLPNDGRAYCVPAATMDLFAFLANIGYSELDPGEGNWEDTSDMDAYYTITEHIDDLGDLMETDATTGTTGSGWYAGTTAWIQDYPGGAPRIITRKLVAELYVASEGYDMTTARAAYHATRGVVVVCYGFYDGDYSYTLEPTGYVASGTLGDRDGGHCVAFSAAERLGRIESLLQVMDPDRVVAGDDLYSQSTMETKNWVTDDVDFDDTDIIHSVMQDRTSAGLLRVIDKIGVIRPYWVITVSENLRDVRVTEVDRWTNGDFNQDYAFAAPIRDVTMRSDQLFAAVVTRDGSGVETAWLLDTRTGEIRSILSGNGLRIAFSRFQELYVVSGNVLRRFDVDRGEPVQLGIATLPIAPRAIEWMDGVDELWGLDAESGNVLTLARDMQINGITQTTEMFHFLARDPKVRMTAVAGDRIALLAPTRGRFATFESTGDRLEEVARYENAYDAKDVSSTDAGNLVVTMRDGALVEFRDDGLGRFVAVDEGPVQGLRSGGVVESARSRTNVEPERHDGPEWRDR